MEQEKLFQFMKPDDHDNFNSLSKNDLNELLTLLDEYRLVYRNHLGLSEDATFGLELEFIPNSLKFATDIYNYLKGHTNHWILKDETTNLGLEVSTSIVYDKEKSWHMLHDVCNFLKQYGQVSTMSGGHIHVGAHVLGEDKNSWYRFLYLIAAYENILYRFGYGEYLNARRSIPYAFPVMKIWEKELKELEGIEDPGMLLQKLPYSRNQSINFFHVQNFKEKEYFNTIEFRFPNASLNPIIWQNNVNTFIKLMLAVKKDSFDFNTVQERLEKNRWMKDIELEFDKTKGEYPFSLKNIEQYEQIQLDQALEFCDLVFENNIDKLYFLRQYLKSNEMAKEPFQKAKKFTR